VLFSLRARWALPAPPPAPTVQQLEKLAPREILDGPHGAAIRRAADDRAAILDIFTKLPKSDRALFTDLEPMVKSLVERVAQLARMLHTLENSIDWRLIDEIDARIAEGSATGATPEGQRRLSLLRRQRATLQDLVERRSALARQIDSAGLALGSLRLDLIKFRSAGGESAYSDVTSATQEVRALAREIDIVLEAAAAARSM
jgi:serine/threonine-protein kinase